jgi:hypothetical protein
LYAWFVNLFSPRTDLDSLTPRMMYHFVSSELTERKNKKKQEE